MKIKKQQRATADAIKQTKEQIVQFAKKYIDIKNATFKFACFIDGHFVYECELDNDEFLEFSFFVDEDGGSLTLEETLEDLMKEVDHKMWKEIKLTSDSMDFEFAV